MKLSISAILLLLLVACGQSSLQRQTNSLPQQQDSCDDPDANIRCCFVYMPQELSSTMTIAGPEEAGERLIISGTVYESDGKTVLPNVVIYAYHTDAKGYYSKLGTERGVQKWHGRLHGWCVTDSNGQYRIITIKPARYPDNTMPAHIHSAIKRKNNQMLWISDFVFRGDDLVNEKYLSSLTAVGGTGVVDLARNSENIWIGRRDIVLTK